jgi:hypothetical protein
MSGLQNPQNVYANSTSYGFRDQSSFYNYRDNSLNNKVIMSGNGQGHSNIFGGGGLRGPSGFGAQNR